MHTIETNDGGEYKVTPEEDRITVLYIPYGAASCPAITFTHSDFQKIIDIFKESQDD